MNVDIVLKKIKRAVIDFTEKMTHNLYRDIKYINEWRILMKKKCLRMIIFLLIIFLISCSNVDSDPTLSNSTSEITDSVDSIDQDVEETEEEFINNETTQVNPDTQKFFIEDWSIKTGDLQYIGTASDGTIYGIGPEVYAIISKSGEVISTETKDYSPCIRYNFSGGSGQLEILQWFSVKSDGTIYSFAYTNGVGPCKFDPNNQGEFEINENSFFSPLAIDSQLVQYPSIPSEYESLQVISSLRIPGWGLNEYFSGGHEVFWLDGRRDRFDFFIHKNGTEAGFVSRDGRFIRFALPEPFETLWDGMVQFEVTPWNDIYIAFRKYDQLGNDLGYEYWGVFNDGSVSETIDSIPKDFSYTPLSYDTENDHLFYFLENPYGILHQDKDFNILGVYYMSSDISFTDLDPKKFFVGHDLALYYFDRQFQTLTKYSYR